MGHGKLGPGFLCLRLLIVFKNLYVYFDAEVALAHEEAWREVQRLWQESEDTVATAVAGVVICSLHSLRGEDKLGTQAVVRSQHILLAERFYDAQSVDQVYGSIDSKQARTRSAIAWGILDYVT